MDIYYSIDDTSNVTNKEFVMTSTDNKVFYTESYYLTNNLKIQMDSVPDILFASLTARKIFYYIIQIIPYNTNVIHFDRKDLLAFLETDDRSVVSNGLKELVELGIIRRVNDHDKNLYALAMNSVVKGNVDLMVKLYKKEQENAEFAASQKACILSYTQLVEKRKAKLNKNKDISTDEQK